MSSERQQDQHTGIGLGVFLIVTTLIGWSSIPLFIKHFSHAIDWPTSNGWRYGFSALVWLPVLLWGWRRGTLPAGLWAAALWPGIFNTLGQTAFAWAHYKIDPGLLTFGMRLQIIFIGVGAYMLFPQERSIVRSWQYIIGFVLVFGGGMTTLFLGKSAPTGAQAQGVVLAIAAGALFAAYALSVRRCMHGMNSVIAFAAISQLTAAAMVATMLFFGDRAGAGALDLSLNQFSLLFVSSMIGIALGHVFYYMSIARLGVAVSSGIVQLQPFLVTAASYALFGERLTGWQWVGGFAAISGALLMLSVQARLTRPRPRPAPPSHTTSIEADDGALSPALSSSDRSPAASSAEKAPVS